MRSGSACCGTPRLSKGIRDGLAAPSLPIGGGGAFLCPWGWVRDAPYTPRGGPSRIRGPVLPASTPGHRAASWIRRPIRARGIRGIRARGRSAPGVDFIPGSAAFPGSMQSLGRGLPGVDVHPGSVADPARTRGRGRSASVRAELPEPPVRAEPSRRPADADAVRPSRRGVDT